MFWIFAATRSIITLRTPKTDHMTIAGKSTMIESMYWNNSLLKPMGFSSWIAMWVFRAFHRFPASFGKLWVLTWKKMMGKFLPPWGHQDHLERQSSQEREAAGDLQPRIFCPVFFVGPPKTNEYHLTRDHFKWTWSIFQPSIFRGHVSFQGAELFSKRCWHLQNVGVFYKSDIFEVMKHSRSDL